MNELSRRLRSVTGESTATITDAARVLGEASRGMVDNVSSRILPSGGEVPSSTVQASIEMGTVVDSLQRLHDTQIRDLTNEVNASPCPLCGSDVKVTALDSIRFFSGTHYKVKCINDSCGCQIKASETLDEAMAKWEGIDEPHVKFKLENLRRLFKELSSTDDEDVDENNVIVLDRKDANTLRVAIAHYMRKYKQNAIT